MTPSERIRENLGNVEGTIWSEDPTYEFDANESLSPFPASRTYCIPGETDQFDFPSLPDGSFCLYDANEHRAIRLWRNGQEIESVLHRNWAALPQCDPVVLAQLLLEIVDGGLSSHCVLRTAGDLASWPDDDFFSGDYELDQSEVAHVRDQIGATAIVCEDNAITIRAVTLYGWMHNKTNLGIEQLRVTSRGEVSRLPRQVLTKKAFRVVPIVLY